MAIRVGTVSAAFVAGAMRELGALMVNWGLGAPGRHPPPYPRKPISFGGSDMCRKFRGALENLPMFDRLMACADSQKPAGEFCGASGGQRNALATHWRASLEFAMWRRKFMDSHEQH
jgi:hypothetical protein